MSLDTGEIRMPIFLGKSLHDWIAALTDVDPRVRVAAAWALSAYGPAAAGWLPKLLELLHDREPAVRATAASSLPYVAPSAEEMVHVLVAALQDEEYEVQSAASRALAVIGKAAAAAIGDALQPGSQAGRMACVRALSYLESAAIDAVPALSEALHDANEEVSEFTARVLGDMGPAASRAVPSLIEVLSNAQESVRRSAARALGKIGQPSALSSLLAALGDDSELVREGVVEAIGDLGLPTPEIVSALAVFLGDRARGPANASIRALGKLGAAALPSVFQAIGSDQEDRRRDAVQVLAKSAPPPAEAAPALIQALADESSWIRSLAADALGALGGIAAEVVPALIAALRDEEKDVRVHAVAALGKIGLAAEDVVAALVGALSDADAEVRSAAVRAMGMIISQRPDLVSVLIETLSRDPDRDVRESAAEALGKVGAITEDVVPALIAALDFEDSLLRHAAAGALAEIGPNAAAAVPALIRVLGTRGGHRTTQERMLSFRAAAVSALRNIGPVTDQVIPALIRAARDEEAIVRNSAIHALGHLRPASPASAEVVAALIDALKDESSNVRWPAADALGDYGAVTLDVVPALIRTLADEQWLVRKAAVEALGKLGSDAKAAVPALESLWLDTSVCSEAAVALYNIGPLSDEERMILEMAGMETKGAEEPAPLPTLVTQVGPNMRITFVALSPDGTKAITDGADRMILWDVPSGRELRRLDIGNSIRFLSFAAFAPDGRRVLICSNKEISLWDLATAAKICEFKVEAAIAAAAFSPDSALLLLADGSSAILYDVESGRALQRFERPGLRIKTVAISPDGLRMLTGDDEAAVEWSIGSGEQTAQLQARSAIALAEYTHAGDCVLLADGNKIRLWNLSTGRARAFRGSAVGVGQMVFAPDDQQVLTQGDEVQLWEVGSGQVVGYTYGRAIGFGAAGPIALDLVGREMQTVTIQHVATGQEVGRLAGRVSFLTGAAFSPDGERLVVASWGGATIWDLKQGKVILSFRHPPSLTPPHLQASEGRWREGKMTSVAFSPDGTQILTGGSDGRAILWDATTGRLLRVFPSATVVEGVAISPDGKKVLIGCTHEAILYDIATGEEIYRLSGHAAQVRYVAFSSDGRKILTGSVESILWDAESGQELRHLQGRIYTSGSALSPDGSKVLAGVQNWAVCWDSATGRVLAEFVGRSPGFAMSEDDLRRNRGHQGSVAALAFSPDGTMALTGSMDGMAIVWELAASDEVYRRFEGHTSAITAALFTPDGKRVLTTALDGTGILWNLETGSQICTLLPFKGTISWAIVDPEGRFDTNDLAEQIGYAWVFADDPFRALPPEIFMRQYYEPRLLPRLLAAERMASVPPLGELNRVQPRVEQLVVAPGETDDSVHVTVSVGGRAGTFQRGGAEVTMETGVYDLRLFREDQLVGQWPAQVADASDSDLQAWRSATRVCDAGESAAPTFTVRLPRNQPGEGIEFSAYAFNADRVKSPAMSVEYRLPADGAGAPAKAYLVTVGINAYQSRQWDLNFAANDARRIQDVVSQALQGYEVVPVSLISEYASETKRLGENTATKANIHNTLKMLAGVPIDPAAQQHLPAALQAATPDDVVLIFFAGHGYTDEAGTFYFFPHDIGTKRRRGELPNDLLRRTISSVELSSWLRPVDAGTIVIIIDSCHSVGAVEPPGFKLGPFGSRGLGQLAFDKGMRVLAASQTEGVALESATIKQGLLTYALVHDGLESGQAAQNGTITLSGWLKYGADRVPELYREIIAGRLRSLRPKKPKESSPPGAVQQPSLFDFTKRSRPIALSLDSGSLPGDHNGG